MDADVHRQLLCGHVDMLVLHVLAEQPRHGYAIRKAIWNRSGGVLALSFGRLYPVLHKLERKKLIVGRDVKRGEVRVVRQYRLTRAGRAELNARRTAWKQISSAIAAAMRA